jgi:predicted transcriptional regulator
MKFARVSLMTLVCIQTIKKLKSLEYLNEEGQVHMSFHESQAREKWEHGSHFPMLGKRQSLVHLPFHYR